MPPIFPNFSEWFIGMFFPKRRKTNACHAGCYCDVDLEPTDNLYSRFQFSRLERAQAPYEHTEHPNTQLGSVSFVGAITAGDFLSKLNKIEGVSSFSGNLALAIFSVKFLL